MPSIKNNSRANPSEILPRQKKALSSPDDFGAAAGFSSF